MSWYSEWSPQVHNWCTVVLFQAILCLYHFGDININMIYLQMHAFGSGTLNSFDILWSSDVIQHQINWIIGSVNVLLPDCRKVFAWTNANLLLSTLRNKLQRYVHQNTIILIQEMHLKLPSVKCSHIVEASMYEICRCHMFYWNFHIGGLTFEVLGPIWFHKWFFHCNSNLMEISSCSNPNCNEMIATKFCMWNDSCHVLNMDITMP